MKKEVTDAEMNRAYLFSKGFEEDFLAGTFERDDGIIFTAEMVNQMTHTALKAKVAHYINLK